MILGVRQSLRSYANPEKAKILQRFFKTGKGEYVLTLLSSNIHEERLLALLILVRRYHRGAAATQEEIVQAYLGNLEYVNNLDLVDSSAHHMPRTMLRYAIERLREQKRQIYLKGIH
jgi:hypothetical protein